MSLDHTTDSELDHDIARRLPRTWDAFFARFGRLTEVQRLTIPHILAGHDVLVCAATATGKTEAACAPLVERFLGSGVWTILYVSPTRALVNDLYERLEPPLSRLGLVVKRRTGEYRPPPTVTPHVLITTPESFDSMLCRGRRDKGNDHVLAHVRAVVLDEVHLLAGTARGEQVRCLQARLTRLRSTAVRKGIASDDGSVQTVALSATVENQKTVLGAYVPGGVTVDVPGKRTIEVQGDAVQWNTVHSVTQYLGTLQEPEKLLVFCNSRRRVDCLTTELKDCLSPMKYRVFPHHSSIAKKRREEAETVAKQERKVVLIATSTLELGIDIGDVDLVVLDGPAPDVSALLQRIGRGNRRTDKTRVMMCATDRAHPLIHQAMYEAAVSGALLADRAGPQFNVIRQQIASYVLQGPRRARSRSKIEDLLEGQWPEVGRDVLDEMLKSDELIEDRSGIRLGEEWAGVSDTGKINSNIESTGGETVVDALGGGQIAVNVKFEGQRRMRVGGEAFKVAGVRGRTVEVIKDPRSGGSTSVKYASQRRFSSASQARSVQRFLKIPETQWPVLRRGHSFVVFHFGGSRRMAVLRMIGRAYGVPKEEWKVDPWTLVVSRSIDPEEKIPLLDGVSPARLELAISNDLDRLERDLARPRENAKLPVKWRIEEVKGWLDLSNELGAIQKSVWKSAIPEVARELGCLL